MFGEYLVLAAWALADLLVWFNIDRRLRRLPWAWLWRVLFAAFITPAFCYLLLFWAERRRTSASRVFQLRSTSGTC